MQNWLPGSLLFSSQSTDRLKKRKRMKRVNAASARKRAKRLRTAGVLEVNVPLLDGTSFEEWQTAMKSYWRQL